MTTTKTLEQALKDILNDDQKISKFDAMALKEYILADGKVSHEEKNILEKAVASNALDQQAYKILHELLMRVDLQSAEKAKKQGHHGGGCCSH